MRTVAALVFENMAPLDLFGPIQVFNVACTPDVQRPNRPDTIRPLYRVITIGKQNGPIPTGREGAGPVVVAEYNIDDDGCISPVQCASLVIKETGPGDISGLSHMFRPAGIVPNSVPCSGPP